MQESMNRLSLSIFCAVLLAVCGVFRAAYACKMASNYYQPTNFDLVQLVDAIVVATPQTQKEVGDDEYELTFSVDQVFKGDLGPVFTDKGGWVSANLGETIPSDPGDLEYAHPESYHGSCIRQMFEKGRPYVLFLSKADDGTYYRPLFAWTRVAEDYYGEDSLWVKTIRYYMDVQKEPDPIKQMGILKKKYQELTRKQEMNDHEAELAVDIRSYLSGVSSYKPTQYLLEEFESLEDKRSNIFSIVEQEGKLDSYLENKRERREAKIKADRLAAGLPEEEDDPFGWDEEEPKVDDPDDSRVLVLEALTEGEHPDAMSFFDELLKKEGKKVRFLSVIARYYAQNGRYRDALELLRDRAFVILNAANHQDAWEFYNAALIIRTDPDDWEKEIWLDDKEVREWWPDFAYSMYSTLVRRQERNFIRAIPKPSSIETELKELRPKDYRSRPDIAVLLANFYKDPVVDWAKMEIEAYIARPSESDDDSRSDILSLPALVFLQGYGWSGSKSEYFVHLQRYFCSNKDVRAALLQQLGAMKDIWGREIVYYFTSYKDYSVSEKELLVGSLISLAARERWFDQAWLSSYIKGEPLKTETMVFQGEPLSAEDIKSEIAFVELGDYLRGHTFRDEGEDEEIKPLVCNLKP